jgi:hypothetical protein
MLAFFAALACIEVGAGLVIGQAWKLQNDHGALSLADRFHLDSLLERLRVMEGVVAAGATACTVLCSVLAVHNTTRVTRGGRRTAALAMGAWIAAPIALVLSRAHGIGGRSTTASVVYLMAQAAVLYSPFWLSGRVADLVNSQRMPFVRWYLAVASAFAVHHVFTASLDLAVPRASDDFGRTAMLYLVNAVIVGVMAVVANEASRGLQISTEEQAWQQRQLQDDAYLRARRSSPVEVLGRSTPEIAGSALARPGVPSIPAPPVPRASSVPKPIAPAPPTAAPTAAPTPIVTTASPAPAPIVASAPLVPAAVAPMSAAESTAAAAAAAVQMAPVRPAASVPVVPAAAPTPTVEAPISPVPDSMAPVSISSLTPLAPRKPAPPTAPAPAPAVTTQEPEPEPAPAPVVRASNGLPSLSAMISSGSATREP